MTPSMYSWTSELITKQMQVAHNLGVTWVTVTTSVEVLSVKDTNCCFQLKKIHSDVPGRGKEGVHQVQLQLNWDFIFFFTCKTKKWPYFTS